ncbi:MAG: hypothetical protein Q8Q32_02750 [bacterium]|nr:hypothetical protein [bacterium]
MRHIIVLNIVALLGDISWALQPIVRRLKRLNRWIQTTPLLSRRAIHIYGMCVLVFVAMPMVTGCGGGIGEVLGYLAFCTPIGPILAALTVVGVILFVTTYDGDDGDPSHPPLVPTPPPPNPPPFEKVIVYFYNDQGSECPVMRVEADDPNDSGDRPVWLFDAHKATNPDGSVDMDPLRMSWPAGSDPVLEDGRVIRDSELIAMFVWFDRDANGAGDHYLINSGEVRFKVYFGNGQTLNVSMDLGFHPVVSTGTTFWVRWVDDGSPNGTSMVTAVEDDPPLGKIQKLGTGTGYMEEQPNGTSWIYRE